MGFNGKNTYFLLEKDCFLKCIFYICPTGYIGFKTTYCRQIYYGNNPR